MATVRQIISQKVRTINELTKLALFGELSSNTDNPKLSYKIILGDSAELSTTTPQDIWPDPNPKTVLSVAEQLDCVSTSIQDDIGGTGTSGIFIEGLDSSFLPISELVILDGTNPVTTTNYYIFISEINCLNIGSSGTVNAGDITVSSTLGDMGFVLQGDSLSKQSQYIIPSGYNGLILGSTASIYRSSGTGVRRGRIDIVFSPLDGGAGDGIEYGTLKLGLSSSAGSSPEVFPVPLVVGEKTLIRPKAIAEANNTVVSLKYTLLLIEATVDIDGIF